jgi:hypothetical protein
MLAKKDSTFLVPPESNYFHPEDLACMRQAFNTACRERPLAASTEDQRLDLAKAIVVSYKPGLSEDDLVAAVLNLAG